MRLKSIELSNFKKHGYLEANFEDGSNLIAGPNYAGKSTILQAVLVGLHGNSMAPGVTSNLIRTGSQDFKIVLKLSNGFVVTRSSRDSTIARGEAEPFARGHTAVNAAVAEELGLDKNAFLKVFTSEQGSPQQLLQMEGSELQRFIESCIGVEQLDETIRKANRESNAASVAAEAVADRVLSLETVTDTLLNQERLVREAGRLEAEQESLIAMIETGKANKSDLQVNLELAQEHNRIATAYQAKQDQMVGLERGETVNLSEDNAKLATTRAQISEQSARAKLVKSKATLERDIEGLSGTLVTDIPKYADVNVLRAQQEQLKAKTREQADVQQYQSVVEKHEADVVRLREMVVQEVPEFVKTEPLQTKMEGAMDLLDATLRNVKRLEDSIKHSDCPTCKRPYDESVCLDDLKAEWNGALELSAKQAEGVGQAKRELHAAKLHNDDVNKLIRSNEDLEHRITLAQETVDEYKARLSTLTQHDLASLETQLSAVIQNIKDAEENNTRVDKLMRANDDIDHKLRRYREELTTVTEELSNMVELNVGVLEQTLEQLSGHIAQQTRLNADIEANNRLLDRLEAELAALPVPQNPVVDTTPLQRELNELDKLIESRQDGLRELVNTYAHTKQALFELNSSLTLHYEAQGKFNEYSGRAKVYKSVSTILADNRSKIISEALAVIFRVASEFASICTDGDLQEVLLKDGAISYREDDSVYSKHSASGSQKTLMGLGMKLGLGKLVRSDFNCLLLDEVSADMDPEVSMRCMLALDTFCGQIVSVSHRPMDIAGNIINL